MEEEKKALAIADDFTGADKVRKRIQKLKESDEKEHKPTFRVTITSGRGFITDSSSSEFYCVITFGKNKQKSQIRKKTLSPEWNESFVFELDATKTLPAKLRIDVFDRKVML